jgi:3-hydroxyisobutyrate dehydrogenase-like beta-hydroxyacid dehydrogenase
VDANAISPQRAIQIGNRLMEAGIAFVDGGIIGGPAWEPNRTWLYLSGALAPEVAAYFAKGPLMPQVLDESPGSASALKMCYAAYTKGTTALLSAILATAESLGVRAALAQQWDREGNDFTAQTTQRVRRVTAKAWRFVGEMEEIAATFRDAGMPGAFHESAADIYQRLASFKGASATPSLEEVLTALLSPPEDEEKQ